MIGPEELAEYITKLQALGITGKAKIGDIEFTIPPVVEARGEARGAGETSKPARSQKAQYDAMLFAATEGIPEEDEATS